MLPEVARRYFPNSKPGREFFANIFTGSKKLFLKRLGANYNENDLPQAVIELEEEFIQTVMGEYLYLVSLGYPDSSVTGEINYKIADEVTLIKVDGRPWVIIRY